MCIRDRECTDFEHYKNLIKNEYDWCISNAINFTPEILINGKSYPKAYDRDDLIYFIEDLSDFYQTAKVVGQLQDIL